MSNVLDKESKKADALANLYRAALYLAKGSRETAIDFLKKAKGEVGGEEIKLLLSKSKGDAETPEKQRYWAEKILDQYNKLRFNL